VYMYIHTHIYMYIHMYICSFAFLAENKDLPF
jgi:hypothetical protein